MSVKHGKYGFKDEFILFIKKSTEGEKNEKRRHLLNEFGGWNW